MEVDDVIKTEEPMEEQKDDGVDYSEYQEDPGDSDQDVDLKTEEKLLEDEPMKIDDEASIKDTVDYKELVKFGIDERVSVEVVKLFQLQKMTYQDLDERAMVALKEFPVKDAITMMRVIHKSSLEHVVNKSAYVCGQMKLFRQNKKTFGSGAKFDPPGPDDEALRTLLKDAGYPLDITPGQRRYGPDPKWEGPPPPAGQEVVVGRLPRQYFEDKLVPLLSDFGRIYELRLMIDSHTGYNRNFCFVTYCTKEDAEKACRLLNRYEIRKGKTLKANISMSNTRIYIGNIPKGKDREQIREELEKLTQGTKEVIVYCNPEMEENNLKNKGYCFVEYEDHKHAALAKKKLENGRTQVWGYDIVVEWAEPQEDPDDESMQKVKVVHVKNLSSDITDEVLKKKFEEFGPVSKCQKVRDYGFVHFEKREDAIQAISELNGKEFGKCEIECKLSKSQVVKRRNRTNMQNPNFHNDHQRSRGGMHVMNDHRGGNWGGNRMMGGAGNWAENRMGGGGNWHNQGQMGWMNPGFNNNMGMNMGMNPMQMQMQMNQGMYRNNFRGYDDDMDYQGGYVNTQMNRSRHGMMDFGGGYVGGFNDFGGGGMGMGMGDNFGYNGGRFGGGNRMGMMVRMGGGMDSPMKRKSGMNVAGWGNKRRK